MASEILSVPEEHLLEVIDVIRVGLQHNERVTDEVREQLAKWCDDEEAYVHGWSAARRDERCRAAHSTGLMCDCTDGHVGPHSSELTW